RSYDADKNTTFALRSKEEADDYRYFPEPDLAPFFISADYIAAIKNALPALPDALQKKYTEQYQLSAYDSSVICADKEDADFYEALTLHTKNYKAAANWMIGPLRSFCNENNIGFAAFPLQPKQVAELIEITDAGKVNFNNASGRILQEMIANPDSNALQAATTLNLLQESDTGALEDWVAKAIESMPDKVKEYKNGKKNLLGLFAGEVKKLSKGKADMQIVTKLLSEKLNN
ncbi:MAG: Asp-tRNA(Asn)/Glu-tRNA(Gln) amidotransferase GatCAB subunit B, partial [Ferruginibacter sp.]